MDITKQYRKENERRRGWGSVNDRTAIKAIWAFMATVAFVMTVHWLPSYLIQFHG